ncbi:MAG: Na+/H+ antiporter subunit E [Anaerolineales bacterium]|nr:Na+/H+ antiporter subunit E [Anaerolineales bacterium]
MFYYLSLTTLLLLLYLSLTTNLEFSNILLGLLISVGILALLRPPRRRLTPLDLISRLWLLLRYLALLAIDLIKSGVVVARLIVQPSMPIHPGIVKVNCPCNSDLSIAVNAHALTVTPGELVVEISEAGPMYVHCLDATHGEQVILEAQKLRRELLQKIIR